MIMLNYKDFVNEQKLFEIGEGSRPFSWKKTGPTTISGWMKTIDEDKDPKSTTNWVQLPALFYEFNSDKATYNVTIPGGFQRNNEPYFGKKPSAKPPVRFNLIIVVSFDIAGKDDAAITNFGEQFRVLTTVTDIIDSAVKEISGYDWVDLKEIRIMPKMEDAEEGVPITQSKRGRLYLEYIKKQGHRLPGDWTASVEKDIFALKKGKWSSTNPDKYIQL